MALDAIGRHAVDDVLDAINGMAAVAVDASRRRVVGLFCIVEGQMRVVTALAIVRNGQRKFVLCLGRILLVRIAIASFILVAAVAGNRSGRRLRGVRRSIQRRQVDAQGDDFAGTEGQYVGLVAVAVTTGKIRRGIGKIGAMSWTALPPRQRDVAARFQRPVLER